MPMDRGLRYIYCVPGDVFFLSACFLLGRKNEEKKNSRRLHFLGFVSGSVVQFLILFTRKKKEEKHFFLQHFFIYIPIYQLIMTSKEIKGESEVNA